MLCRGGGGICAVIPAKFSRELHGLPMLGVSFVRMKFGLISTVYDPNIAIRPVEGMPTFAGGIWVLARVGSQ